mmetsp:Transcript_82813/g.208553  ORF Transcript_82813/g.208553 Transcript_82813/m.208553 type:complete len:398 (+) Transcript_82813:88-1281(+)
MQYDVVQPQAASPKAPGVLGNARSYLSFSSAETVTPESGAGGWPSRASGDGSGVDNNVGFAGGGSFLSRGISPESHPSLVDLAEKLNSSSKHYLSSGHTDVISTRAGTANTSARPTRGARAGELRRRKYAAPQGHQLHSGSGVGVLVGALVSMSHRLPQHALTPASSENQILAGEPLCKTTPRHCSSFAGGMGCCEPKDCEVLVEGPMQQRALLFFWRWRWCVLTHEDLRIYMDEQSSLLMPERPLERHPASKLGAAPDLHFPTVLVCTSLHGTGEPLMYLRTGPGLRWEELAAASLWLRAFASLHPAGGHNSTAVSEGPTVTTVVADVRTAPGAATTVVGGVLPVAALALEACAAAPTATDAADIAVSLVPIPASAPVSAPRADAAAHVASLQVRT